MRTDQTYTNGRLTETYDGPGGTYTRYNAAGKVVQTRPLTAAELAALTVAAPTPTKTDLLLDALAAAKSLTDITSSASSIKSQNILTAEEIKA